MRTNERKWVGHGTRRGRDAEEQREEEEEGRNHKRIKMPLALTWRERREEKKERGGGRVDKKSNAANWTIRMNKTNAGPQSTQRVVRTSPRIMEEERPRQALTRVFNPFRKNLTARAARPVWWWHRKRQIQSEIEIQIEFYIEGEREGEGESGERVGLSSEQAVKNGS